MWRRSRWRLRRSRSSSTASSPPRHSSFASSSTAVTPRDLRSISALRGLTGLGWPGAGIAAEAICLNQRQAYEQCILANGKEILNEIGQSAARHCPEEMDRFEQCAKAHGADSCLGENKATLVCGAEAVLRRLRRVG